MNDTKTSFDNYELWPDFKEIDPDKDHWCMVEYGGMRDFDGRVRATPATWCVPNTDAESDMTAAMMSEIPGLDDTVTPRKLEDTRFWKFAMAYLMQDGNLGVPGGRYGSDTRDCAPLAIVMALIMQYHNGEPITYYQLHSDMGLVVNSHDDVATLLSESQHVFDEESGIDVKELLGNEYIPQTPVESVIKWAEERGCLLDKWDGDTMTLVLDEGDCENLADLVNGDQYNFLND